VQGDENELRRLIQEHGTLWQDIAREYNQNVEVPRTPANLKDKWKQMGAENYAMRLKGPWGLEEAL